MPERDLLLSLYAEAPHGWRDVACRLGRFSGAQWGGIANGTKHATLEQRNLIRAACGLEPLVSNVAQQVADLGIDSIVQVDKRPNTAILAAVSGDVLNVTIKTGVSEPDESSGITVTLGYRLSKRRKARRGNRVVTFDEIAPRSAKTRRGHSPNFEAISAVLGEAALIYEEATT